MKVRIPTRDGNAFDAHLSLPPGNKGPGVVMIPEIFGVNEGIHRAADLFARQGYVVLALDIFWRMERNVELGYDEAGFEKAYALHAAFDYEQGVADMGDAVEHLRAMESYTGKVFVTGYCLGGTMSYLAAARLEVDGAAGNFKNHLIHDDGKGFECYVERHNQYTSLEAVEIVRLRKGLGQANLVCALSAPGPARRRWLNNFAQRWLTMRPLCVFLYMYVLKAGFLDGRIGLRYFLLKMFFEFQIELKVRELHDPRSPLYRRYEAFLE